MLLEHKCVFYFQHLLQLTGLDKINTVKLLHMVLAEIVMLMQFTLNYEKLLMKLHKSCLVHFHCQVRMVEKCYNYQNVNAKHFSLRQNKIQVVSNH